MVEALGREGQEEVGARVEKPLGESSEEPRLRYCGTEDETSGASSAAVEGFSQGSCAQEGKEQQGHVFGADSIIGSHPGVRVAGGDVRVLICLTNISHHHS